LLLDRRRRGDPFLVWKVRIFSVAAGVALVGIWLDERWMTGTALALLLGGVLLRFMRKDEPGDDLADDADVRELDATE
jgi:hypothetical protein